MTHVPWDSVPQGRPPPFVPFAERNPFEERAQPPQGGQQPQPRGGQPQQPTTWQTLQPRIQQQEAWRRHQQEWAWPRQYPGPSHNEHLLGPEWGGYRPGHSRGGQVWTPSVGPTWMQQGYVQQPPTQQWMSTKDTPEGTADGTRTIPPRHDKDQQTGVTAEPPTSSPGEHGSNTVGQRAVKVGQPGELARPQGSVTNTVTLPDKATVKDENAKPPSDSQPNHEPNIRRRTVGNLDIDINIDT